MKKTTYIVQCKYDLGGFWTGWGHTGQKVFKDIEDARDHRRWHMSDRGHAHLKADKARIIKIRREVVA